MTLSVKILCKMLLGKIILSIMTFSIMMVSMMILRIIALRIMILSTIMVIIIIERCFTRVGSGLTRKHYAKLESVARDKHSSLLQKSVNYGRNKFYHTGPWSKISI
jgi:hypothetical protein